MYSSAAASIQHLMPRRSSVAQRGPVRTQAFRQFRCALLGEEQLAALYLDHFARAGKSIAQPVRPLRLEEDISVSPHDESGHGQFLQLRLHGQQVLRFQGGQRPLVLPGGGLGAEHGPEITADRLVAEPFGVLVSAPELAAGAYQVQVFEEAGGVRGDLPPGRPLYRGFERRGRNVVMRLAVGEDQAPQEAMPPGREDLRDPASGVIADEVDPSEPQSLTEVFEDGRETREGEILVGCGRAAAVQGEVDREAATFGLKQIDNVTPQVSIRADSMEEQHDTVV